MTRSQEQIDGEEEKGARRQDVPHDVAILRSGIKAALMSEGGDGNPIGSAKYGVYAFYDYDGEPIYVGQTQEKLGARIGRHLTNQRTDAVAMKVLDPFEVAEIEMWPFYKLIGKSSGVITATLNKAEFTVYTHAIAQSSFKAVLNEKLIGHTNLITLPKSVRKKIVPDDVFAVRKHPDTRIARRAGTIAELARVISERNVSPGLRKTLVTQAQRLEHLAEARYSDIAANKIIGSIDVATPTASSPLNLVRRYVSRHL